MAKVIARRFHLTYSGFMPYVIAEPCIGIKDTACVDACPVDVIHPRPGERDFAPATQLYIFPDNCIDCGACVQSVRYQRFSNWKIFRRSGLTSRKSTPNGMTVRRSIGTRIKTVVRPRLVRAIRAFVLLCATMCAHTGAYSQQVKRTPAPRTSQLD